MSFFLHLHEDVDERMIRTHSMGNTLGPGSISIFKDTIRGNAMFIKIKIYPVVKYKYTTQSKH